MVEALFATRKISKYYSHFYTRLLNTISFPGAVKYIEFRSDRSLPASLDSLVQCDRSGWYMYHSDVIAARSIFLLPSCISSNGWYFITESHQNRFVFAGRAPVLPKQSFCIRKLNQNLQKSNVEHFNIIHI